MDVEQTLKAYESDPGAESTIRKVITDAYKGLQPELETINKYETEQLPSFYDAFSGFGMGTGAADMSPLARLQAATGDVARKSALARTARDIFSTRQSGMEDLIGSAYRQWQTGYGSAQDAWNRWWQQKQHADQMELGRAQIANSKFDFPEQTTPTMSPLEKSVSSLIKATNNALVQRVGGDNKVSPQTFIAVRNKFNNALSMLGLNNSQLDFNKQFGSYVNPSHSMDYYKTGYGY